MKTHALSDSSTQHSPRERSPLTKHDCTCNGHLMIKLQHLEECVARLADFAGHTSRGETSVASQQSQGQGSVDEAIPKPAGIYEDIIETGRPGIYEDIIETPPGIYEDIIETARSLHE